MTNVIKFKKPIVNISDQTDYEDLVNEINYINRSIMTGATTTFDEFKNELEYLKINQQISSFDISIDKMGDICIRVVPIKTTENIRVDLNLTKELD